MASASAVFVDDDGVMWPPSVSPTHASAGGSPADAPVAVAVGGAASPVRVSGSGSSVPSTDDAAPPATDRPADPRQAVGSMAALMHELEKVSALWYSTNGVDTQLHRLLGDGGTPADGSATPPASSSSAGVNAATGGALMSTGNVGHGRGSGSTISMEGVPSVLAAAGAGGMLTSLSELHGRHASLDDRLAAVEAAAAERATRVEYLEARLAATRGDVHDPDGDDRFRRLQQSLTARLREVQGSVTQFWDHVLARLHNLELDKAEVVARVEGVERMVADAPTPDGDLVSNLKQSVLRVVGDVCGKYDARIAALEAGSTAAAASVTKSTASLAAQMARMKSDMMKEVSAAVSAVSAVAAAPPPAPTPPAVPSADVTALNKQNSRLAAALEAANARSEALATEVASLRQEATARDSAVAALDQKVTDVVKLLHSLRAGVATLVQGGGASSTAPPTAPAPTSAPALASAPAPAAAARKPPTPTRGRSKPPPPPTKPPRGGGGGGTKRGTPAASPVTRPANSGAAATSDDDMPPLALAAPPPPPALPGAAPYSAPAPAASNSDTEPDPPVRKTSLLAQDFVRQRAVSNWQTVKSLTQSQARRQHMVSHAVEETKSGRAVKGAAVVLNFERRRAAHVLNTSATFHGLDSADALELVQRSELRKYKAGELLIRQGTRGSCMFVVIEGEVVVFLDEGNLKSKELTRRFVGEVVGEFALVSEHSIRAASVVASVPVTALLVPKAAFVTPVEGKPTPTLQTVYDRIVSSINRTAALAEKE